MLRRKSRCSAPISRNVVRVKTFTSSKFSKCKTPTSVDEGIDVTSNPLPIPDLESRAKSLNETSSWDIETCRRVVLSGVDEDTSNAVCSQNEVNPEILIAAIKGADDRMYFGSATANQANIGIIESIEVKKERKAWKRPKLTFAQQTFERTGRNEPCPCGSGKKFKRCCLKKELI